MILDSASVDDTADGQPGLAHIDCQPAVPNTLWRIVARLVPEYQITSIFPPRNAAYRPSVDHPLLSKSPEWQ